MPRPPILPPIDWKALFESGEEYDSWIRNGEHPENQEAMQSSLRDLPLEPHWQAFLSALQRPVHVLAIAEDWCGDVVRHVPVLQRLAQAAPNLRVRYVSRERSPEAFARFLTNGGEAIPKFVFFSDNFVECGNWGPMPEACKELIARGKACGDVAAARKKVAALYEADPEKLQVAAELLRLVDIAATQRP